MSSDRSTSLQYDHLTQLQATKSSPERGHQKSERDSHTWTRVCWVRSTPASMSKPSGTMRNPQRTNRQEETPRHPSIHSRMTRSGASTAPCHRGGRRRSQRWGTTGGAGGEGEEPWRAGGDARAVEGGPCSRGPDRRVRDEITTKTTKTYCKAGKKHYYCIWTKHKEENRLST
jgi:hypothetical protein